MLTASMLPLRMLGLLMLMSSLCDADNRCPTEVFLDPPEILAEHGKTVMVNCSSGENIHDGMYWKVGDTDSLLEYGTSASESVQLYWNVTAECRIKLDSTIECSKDLKITLYKNPETVDLFPTKHVAAVEGKQYELQCDVVDVAPVQRLIVRWYRGNETIKTDYSIQPNTTKRIVSESFTLEANFSRGENGARFRCEAQLDFGQHGSQPRVISKVHTVSVHYAPELKNQTEDVYVNEGDYVTLDCEAEGHPAPAFRWSSDGVNLTETTNDLNITLATSAIYNCTATNYLGHATKQIHVHVKKTNIMEAPAAITTPEPSTPRRCPLVLTPAKIVVRFGDPVSVNCSTSATGFAKIGWEAISGGMVSTDSVVTWTVEQVKDWNTKPLCYIDLINDQCFTMLDITLYKTPDSVSVSALDQGPMVEGTEYRLKCDITNVAPVQTLKVKWYRGSETVQTQMFNNDTRHTPVNVSSTLRVTPERDHDGVLFRCEAELHLGLNGSELVPNVTSSPYKAVVHYKPLVKTCRDSYAGVEREFSIDRLSCEVDGNPPPTFRWYHEEKLINASEPLTRTQSGLYTAEITNSLGSSNFSVLITVEYGPSFTCAAHPELMEGDTFQCEADGVPRPAVTWFKGEKERGEEVAAPQRWTKNDHGNYSLQATNKHGQATHELHVVVLYGPVFNGSYSLEVTVILGENVTFNCSADGQPPPEIKWSYSSKANVTETTKGRQKSISVTRATSTHAGTYVCDAKNKVGVVKRTVTLVVKDRPKQKAIIATMWWLLIVLVVILILIIIIIFYRWKKQGQYAFIPDRANEHGSDIPMAPQANGVQV